MNGINITNATLHAGDLLDSNGYLNINMRTTTITGVENDHDRLDNLAYDVSGHTGFASDDSLLTASGILDDKIDTTSGTLQDQIDNISVGAVTHNLTTGIQGGTTGEYYHLTAAEYSDFIGASELDAIYATDADLALVSGSLQDQIDNLTPDHASLTNLDYASSGHTGFQPAGDYATNSGVSSVSGTLQTQINNLDTVYATDAQVNTISGAIVAQIITDHGGLTGLSDNDHPQYDFSTASGILNSKIDTTSGTLQTEIDQLNASVAGVVLWMVDVDSDIVGYEVAGFEPGGNPEDTDTVIVNNGTGEVLIGAYITASGTASQVIPAGLWNFNIYAAVDSATGITQIVSRIYKRSSGGTETELFNVTTAEINNTTVAVQTVQSFQNDFVLSAGDRIVVKFYGKSTSVTDRTITYYYEGTTNYTHINTPIQAVIFSDHGELTGLADDDHPQYALTNGSRDITGQQIFENNVVIRGNLVVSGTQVITEVEDVLIEDHLLTLNYGETASGISFPYAGIEIERGTATNYLFVFDETADNFQVGVSGSLQPVATREDTPLSSGVALWNASLYRFDTIPSTSYSASTHTHDDRYYTDTELVNGILDGRYYTETEVDTISGALNTKISNTSTGHDHDGVDSKKVTYTDLLSIPASFTPASHGNEAHSSTFITSAGVTYENLNGNSDVGTGADQVAVGNHSHAQLHDRSHAMTSTSDHTAGNWKVFHSNGSGQLVELALGDNGKVLTSNGASSAPTFETPTTGSTTFLALTDTPDSYSGQGEKFVKVNAGATALEFSASSATLNLVDDTTPQLGGDLDTNGKNIVMTPAPSSDDTACGDIATLTVDTNGVGIGAALFMASDGNFDEADADAITTMPCVALALETGTGSKKVLLRGFIRNDDWTWTVGGLVYVSTTQGTLTQTAPAGTGDQVQIVGFATHADRMFFNPNYAIAEVK